MLFGWMKDDGEEREKGWEEDIPMKAARAGRKDCVATGILSVLCCVVFGWFER